MWDSLTARFKGWKTMVFSVALILFGIIGTVLMSIDATMLTTLLPDKYKPFAPLIITVIGAVVGVLRVVTTGPVGEKDA